MEVGVEARAKRKRKGELEELVRKLQGWELMNGRGNKWEWEWGTGGARELFPSKV